jgi:hypothetical protein
VAAVDDAADGLLAGRLRLLDHHVDVVREAGRDRTALLFGERLRERIADRQVLVEERRPDQRLRRNVFEQRADDGAARKRGRLRLEAAHAPDGGGNSAAQAGAQQAERLTAIDSGSHRTPRNFRNICAGRNVSIVGITIHSDNL